MICTREDAQKKKKGRLPALGKVNMRSGVIVIDQTHVHRDFSTLDHQFGRIRSEPPRHLYTFISPTALFILPHIAIMTSDMDFDDDGPPMLVSADQPDDAENLSNHVDDMNLTRVPITIITGMDLLSVYVNLY